jgi:acetyltransferase-like isoleucine patch superfamily enzyme
LAVNLDHDWYSRPLPDNVRLGTRDWLYSSFAFKHYRSQVPHGVSIGADTGLYAGTFFDLGPDARVEIGNYCSIVGAIFATNGRVTVGDYALIAHDVVIADSDWQTPDGDPCAANSSPAASPPQNSIEIGRNVWIGMRAILLGSLRIGDGAIVAAGTLVTHDVPPFTVCAGNPMTIVRKADPISDCHEYRKVDPCGEEENNTK